MYSLACVACHVPCGGGDVHQIRLSPEMLCAHYHTLRDATPGDVPDRAEVEFMRSVGRCTLNGSRSEGLYPSTFTDLGETAPRIVESAESELPSANRVCSVIAQFS